ncbi:CoA transferase [Nonomuraea sp. NN258]|uniref:CaiB/BaiF CoA transferase family protein n=1 Tax=Nonomuraea antri TaxID=2730852 RepID=UPI001569855C|nr:CoA transferase [Nonomuraea antri]NRQ33682.1 CoA transferase [Nonomuraea antri]
MRTNLLSGVRVLAVEQYGAAPFGTQLLGHLGAEIIKIEQPGDGDVSRSVGPLFREDLPRTARSVFFQGLNSGKKSLTLNLAHEEGGKILAELAADADAVVSNLRGDVPDRLGLTFAALGEANPRIVCGHLTGYGRTGERAARPGYDYLMQAELGYFDLTGEPGGPPSRMGISMIDLTGGVMLALATVSAILRARDTGRGGDVDVSLFDVALFSLNYPAHWYLNGGLRTSRLPRSAHPSLTPCQSYRTADGWIYLMCNKEKFWPALCERIGRPEWADDRRFSTFADRLTSRDELTVLLDRELSARTTAEWLAVFGDAVPAAPILTLPQAMDSHIVADGDRIEQVDVGQGSALRLLAGPIRTDGPSRRPTRAPALGEQTDELLTALGRTTAEIGALRALGVI